MILPKDHRVSQLLVRHYHETATHSGKEQTLCELRRTFWIVAGRSLVKGTTRNCVKCRGLNPKREEQLMGPLPRARLEACYPQFSYTGVDLFGSLTV